jgi:hypothetical protein
MCRGCIKTIILYHAIAISGNMALVAVINAAVLFGVARRFVFCAGNNTLCRSAARSLYYPGFPI